MTEENTQDNSFIPLQERMRATLGKNLILARRAKYLSQNELGEKAGHSRETLALIETGKADPPLSVIVDFANALNMNPFLLMMGDSDFKVLIEMSEELGM